MGSNPTGPVSISLGHGGIREGDTSDPARGCVSRICDLWERSEPQIANESHRARIFPSPIALRKVRQRGPGEARSSEPEKIEQQRDFFMHCASSPRALRKVRQEPADILNPAIIKKFEPGKIRALLAIQPGLPGLVRFSSCLELSRRAMLLEALPAIYRPALGGLERYLAVLPAVRAFRLMHLSGATKAPSTPVSVSVSHVLTLYCSTSPSRILFASCAPLRGGIDRTTVLDGLCLREH